MIKSICFFLWAACLAALIAPSTLAITYVVPPDVEMIQSSDDIVIATGVTSVVERTERGGIVTRYTVRVEETLKGDRSPGDYLVLTELGGVLNEVDLMVLPGTPEYSPGTRYLIFTESNSDGDPTTFGVGLGQFTLVLDDRRFIAFRGEITGFSQNLEVHAERLRDATQFMKYIRGIVLQRIATEPTYFMTSEKRMSVGAKVAPNAAFTRRSYLWKIGLRWQNFSTASFVTSGNQGALDGTGAVTNAISEWNNTATSIDYGFDGDDPTATAGLTGNDGKNTILFGDPNDEIPGSAIAGRGGVTLGASGYDLNGESFSGIAKVDVVINDTATASCIYSVMTHEVGHTLGLRHSNQNGDTSTTNPPPCEPDQDCAQFGDAIMNSTADCSRVGILEDYDIRAATTVYGTGPICNPPTITTQPQNKNVSVGTQTTLSVVAGGSSPFTYQWFFGDSPDTNNAVTGATSTSINITPTSAGVGKYWVRVSHTCSASVANSNTATVTATCTNPAITSQSGNVTITGGQSTQLQVNATGSGLSYQWYEGALGNTSQPRGSNSKNLTVSPSANTTYWVRVTGLCGSPVDSNLFTVTVIPCADITVNPPTATPGVGAGQYTLSVTAFSTSTPLTYGWYRGGTPGFEGTANAQGTGQTLSVTVPTPGAFNYWARVQNGCGRVEYSTIITLASCTLPTIATQPTDKTVNFNQSAALSIAVSAGATVKWFRGAVGDTTNQIGTGISINTPALTATTQFWAEVRNGNCGPISSRQVTVTVQQLAELITVLNGRFYLQVRYINQFENPPATGKLLGRSLFSSSTSETAIFTFGDPLVVELMVRLSDARPFDDKIHLYLGGLSDVEFYIVVTDSLSGIVKEYHKEKNQLLGEIDRTTFPAAISLRDGVDALMARAAMPPKLDAEVSVLNLLNNRFQVRMSYRNQFSNPVDEGFMSVRSIASSPTTETAVFFFGENVGSVEWMVRFSDARPFAERIDFFHGGLSDVEFTIEVTDTLKGITREYHKLPFSLAGQVDRDSFTP